MSIGCTQRTPSALQAHNYPPRDPCTAGGSVASCGKTPRLAEAFQRAENRNEERRGRNLHRGRKGLAILQEKSFN